MDVVMVKFNFSKHTFSKKKQMCKLAFQTKIMQNLKYLTENYKLMYSDVLNTTSGYGLNFDLKFVNFKMSLSR